ncbi:MAG: GtrA family protein [Bdellovibrionia bacterium]
MKHLFIGKTQSTALQFLRYLFVGGLAAAFDAGTLYFLSVRLGVNHLIAAALGFFLGLLVNYFISIAWVFESNGRYRQEMILFALIGAGGLVLTEFIMWATVDMAKTPVMLGKIIALFLVLIWNFGMRKKFVFALQ